jgi:serine/threonine protein kinase
VETVAHREQFGRYLLLERLGQGGMAQIWRARLGAGERGSREVVVKTLQSRLVGQPLFTALLAAEARITRLLSHPGIVRIVDDGVIQKTPYVAMERVDGCDLSQLLRAVPSGQRVPVGVVLSIAIEMCRALGYAHAWRNERGKLRPIVHGDLSPSNLMVRRDGGVTVIDFGVAHMDPRIARAQAHLVIGKSGYFAPELFDDVAANARSDVFSLGVVLHELLAGRHLFVVESERETLRRLSEATIPPPSNSNPRVSATLDAIVLRALSRDPKQRYASANELADALERLSAPARATRNEVGAFVRSVLAGNPRCEEPSASLESVYRATTRPAPQPAPDDLPRRRRTHASIGSRALLAVAVLAAALLAPAPRVPARWLPIVAEIDAPAITTPAPAADEPTPRASAVATPRARPAHRHHSHHTR